MTKAVLFSSENIRAAKAAIYPYARDFLKVEPGNTMVLPETPQGAALVDQAFARLESMGYSPEDAQLLMSEVVDKIDMGDPETYGADPNAAAAPASPAKKNEF